MNNIENEKRVTSFLLTLYFAASSYIRVFRIVFFKLRKINLNKVCGKYESQSISGYLRLNWKSLFF
jgi:hypothetical protein